MNQIIRLLPPVVALAAALAFAQAPALAQQTAAVVSTCGSATYTAGTTNNVTMDVNGNQCGGVNVQTINGQAAAAGSGATTAGTLRVVAATDDPVVSAINAAALTPPIYVNPDSVVDKATVGPVSASGAAVFGSSTVVNQGFASVTIKFTLVGSGAQVAVQTSADGTPGTGSTFQSISAWSAGNLYFPAPFTPTTSDTYCTPITGGNTIRLNQTAGSGTSTAYMVFSRAPCPQAPVIFNGSYDDSPTTPGTGSIASVELSKNRGVITRPFANANNSWSYAAASGGISNTTTAVTIRAAQTGLKNCVSHIDLSWSTLSASTEVAIRDGAGGTVLWRGILPTTAGQWHIGDLLSPICNAANNTLLEALTITAVTGAVYLNISGDSEP